LLSGIFVQLKLKILVHFISKANSFYRIPTWRKLLFFRVVLLSLRRGILTFFRSSSAYTENLNSTSRFPRSEKPTESQLALAKDIAFAIELGRKYIPWKNLCRHQAWQAVYLLQKVGIPFTYHVGVKINEPKRGEGHAWVMVGGKFVSGKCRLSDYKEITFEKKF